MKRIFMFMTLAVFLSSLIHDKAYSQDARNTIRDLMRFYYVARINDPAYTPELLDNAAIMRGTETGGFWTNRNMAGPQRLVRSLLAANGDDRMQRVTAKVLRILNRPVKVNLLDDSVANVGSVATSLYGACLGTRGKAWPCASNMTRSDDSRADCARILGVAAPARRDAQWAGNVCMGTVYFTGGNQTDKLSTIIHELLHTQDYTDGRAHLFWVDTVRYRYGGDDTHFTTEAIPNMAITYQEGAANIMKLLYDHAGMARMFRWFAGNGQMLVEQALHPPNTRPSDSLHRCIIALTPSPDVWLYNQLTSEGIRPERTVTEGGATYGLFRINTLPARIIAHNEYILAMVGAAYAEHVGETKLFNAIRDVNSQGLRTSGSPLAMFYRSLCHQALPAGQTVESLLRTPPASGVARPYLLPIAYADFFTAYRSRTKEQLKAVFENQSYMNDWVDLYWDHGRTLVRTAVPLTNLVQGKLTDIAISMGITSSTGGD